MMGAFTFGQALAQWMQQRGYSRAALARMTNTRSATTIARLINDQSTPKRCQAFLEEMIRAFPDMTEAELLVLRRGLAASNESREDTRAMGLMAALLRSPTRQIASTPLSELLASHLDADIYELYCIQCVDATVLSAFELLLSRGDQRVQIHHYLVAPVPGGMTAYTVAASRFLCDPRYRIYYQPTPLPEGDVWRPGSLMILRTKRNQSEQQWLILPQPGGQYSALPLDTVDLYHFFTESTRQNMAHIVPMNTSWMLNTPRVCLDYLRQCYDRERDRACYLLRSKPDLSMIPVDMLQTLYNEAATLRETSVKDYALELRRVCYLRYTNQADHSRPTYAIFSQQALRCFMKSGLLLNHFRSLRPFTCEERRRILEAMIHQAENVPHMHLYIARDERLFREVQISCYADSGVLLSSVPAKRVAYSPDKPYCEAFVQDATFARQYADFYTHTLLPRCAHFQEESIVILRSILNG